MLEETYEIYALKYAERNSRTRADSFLFDDNHDAPHAMDYFIWVVRNNMRTIVVDTGYDAEEGKRRGRPVLQNPAQVLSEFGVSSDSIKSVIITHMHYDHAGTLDQFPNAVFHVQASEMAFATGPCMCHDALRMPYTVEHVVDMVRKVYSGRVIFYEGAGLVAPGIELVEIGGHSRGLQAVRVKTSNGWLVLASDASHYYENFLSGKPFPIVENLEAMHKGFATLKSLATSPEMIIPGHDPLVREIFPEIGHSKSATIHRLDQGPTGDFDALMSSFRD